jgi:hypothetical protein
VLATREQPSFAAGMFQSVAPERIPQDGAWDIENGLLEEDGTANRRGGTNYATATLNGSDLTWIWAGYVGSSSLVLAADAADYGQSIGSGAWTNLGGTGRAGPAGRAAVMGSTLYLPGGATITSAPAMGAAAAKVAPYYAVVANRLLAGNGNRIDFSGVGTPGTFGATDFHVLPDGVSITGLEGLRDSAVAFTTRGIYIVSGLALNLTDPDGNVQHRIDRYSRDGILWGDAGIASWEGGLVAPMRDGVWLISLGVASEALQAYRLLSGPITDLYKSYVDAGATPGGAAVYRGHYILPILSGGSCIDTLVCRMDMAGAPWVRATGAGAQSVAYAVNPGGPDVRGGTRRQARGVNWFTESPTDVDGSAVAFRLRTRDTALGGRRGTIVKVRAEYELAPVNVETTLAADDISGGPGNLGGVVADVGGSWVTSGTATDDFQVGNLNGAPLVSAGVTTPIASAGVRFAQVGSSSVAAATVRASLMSSTSRRSACRIRPVSTPARRGRRRTCRRTSPGGSCGWTGCSRACRRGWRRRR